MATTKTYDPKKHTARVIKKITTDYDVYFADPQDQVRFERYLRSQIRKAYGSGYDQGSAENI
jgi:hypothetical protein